MPLISLAVPTYNQAPLLRRFLVNYLRDGADLVPLVVVDDGSSDDTGEVLRNLAGHPGITVHSLPHVSAAHARNHALRHASTEWLAFSDTDCLLDRSYFRTLASVPARFPAAAAVEGAVRPTPGPKPPFTHSLHNPAGGTYATANMVFRVAPILDLGGFDEGFTVNFREDTDLALTILDRLGPIPFCSDLVVEHPHIPRDFAGALRKAYATQDRVVRAEIRLFEKHPHSYGSVRHYRDARGTLLAWCGKYFALYFKECLRYLFKTPGLTGRERLRGLLPAGQAMIVALLEQICIAGICMVQLGKITRLKAQPPVKILILWSGAVVPAYRRFFLELAGHMQVRVLSPRRWMHGSKVFSGSDAGSGMEAAGKGSAAGDASAGETAKGARCEIVPAAYLPERSSRYWVPSLVYHLWAFRPRYLYIMDEMDRPSLAWHALSARLAWPPVRIINYSLQNIPRPGYYRWHHRLATRINHFLVWRGITASREADDVLRANGYRKPTRIIPLWASEAFFFPGRPEDIAAYRRRRGIPEGDVLLVYAGSMVECKGLLLLREAMAAIQRRSRDSRLWVISAGNGPLAASLPEGSEGRWIHLGALEAEELRSLYQAGDYVILPSLTRPDWKEQIGRSLIEGILCGCIALGSDSGHIPELTLMPQAAFRQGDAGSLLDLLAGLPLAHAAAVREAQARNVRVRFTSSAVARETFAFLNEGDP